MNSLRLRPLTEHDEPEFVVAHKLLEPDGFTFGLGYRDDMAWTSYLERLADIRAGRNLGIDEVPATFLVADVGGTIVGRTSIRHSLMTTFLATEGGHIGYGVIPNQRRKGYASEILDQSLIIARGLGLGRVLVTCGDENLASSKVIEHCGGVLESVINLESGSKLRRYWFA